jgi:hypothetical protein
MLLPDNSFKNENIDPLNFGQTTHHNVVEGEMDYEPEILVTDHPNGDAPGNGTPPITDATDDLPPPPKKNGKFFPLLLLILAVVAFMYFKNR